MKWRKLLAVMLCGVALFSCSDDNESNGLNGEVPQSVLDAFNKKYQGVKDAHWNKVKNFYVARFNSPISKGVEAVYTSSAWFTADGLCHQSDEDVTFAQLPDEVKRAFEQYKAKWYSDWHVDHCEKVLRGGMDLIYVIEIEKGEEEREISISEKGDILKDVTDADDDYVFPVIISPELMDALHRLYPDNWDRIGILEVEVDEDEVEVDIFDNGRHKELTFDLNYALLCVEYKVTLAEAKEKLLSPELYGKLVKFVRGHGLDIEQEGIVSEIEVNEDERDKGRSFDMEFEDGKGKKVEVRIDKEGNISLDD